jgi:hypothetical protein
MIKSVFHININVTDFDKSLAFYKMLGFKVVLDIGEGPNKANDKGLNIPDSRARAALLALSDDPAPPASILSNGSSRVPKEPRILICITPVPRASRCLPKASRKNMRGSRPTASRWSPSP